MKVLIAEDDITSRLILERLLPKWGYEVVSTRDGAEAWARLQEPESPKLMVLDWMMPEMDGVEVCRRLRDRNGDESQYPYVIMLTAKGKKEDIAEGMAAGADDYLIKPFEQGELQVRLRTGRRIVELQTELLQARRVLMEQAMVDPHSGLYNQPAVVTRIKEELSRAGRSRNPLSLALLEFDRSLGLEAEAFQGSVVVECSERIHQTIRLYDMLGHWGKNRFVLVLPGADANVAPAICERVRQAISSRPLMSSPGTGIKASLSLGVAVWDGSETLDMWIGRATEAVMGAKGKGGDCLVVA